MKLMKRIAVLVATAAVFGVVAGASMQAINWYQARKGDLTRNTISENVKDASKIEATSTTSGTETVMATATATDLSTVVSNVIPSIVAITCTVKTETHSFFEDFFGPQESTAAGTGIIVGENSEGILIATNNHVIEGATDIVVTFIDDSTAKGTIKGAASADDLAIVLVKFDELSDETAAAIRIASIGNSDSLEMGDMVIAIGNALGYGQSTTVGYISATEREVTIDGITLNLIQTDTAINPGNSGGALINTKGEVIGINSSKFAATEVEGMGYAIPINAAVPILNDLTEREELAESEQGYLGINGNDITAEYESLFNLPSGVYVSKILEDSPAEQAGLNVGDIIVGINNTDIDTKEDIAEVLSYTRAGTEVELRIKSLQDGEYVDKTIKVTLGSKAGK